MSEENEILTGITLPPAMASETVGACLWIMRVFMENGYRLNHPQQLVLHKIAGLALEDIHGDQDWYQMTKDLQAAQSRLIAAERLDPETAQRIGKIGTILRQIQSGTRDDDLYERAKAVL